MLTSRGEQTGAADPRRHAADLVRAVRIDLRRGVGRSLSIGLLACAVLAVPFAMHYEHHVAVKKERAQADEQRIVDLVAQTALRETFRKIYPLVGDSSGSLPAVDGAAPADAGRYRWIAATFLAQGLLIAQSEAVARARVAGFDHHVVKPFDPAELAALIAKRE